jgi:short-subunit dehydrogenase
MQRTCYFFVIILIVILCVSCMTRKPGKRIAKKLHNKTVVIIGASSGIGKGVALKLAEFNCNLIICAPNSSQLESVAADCRKSGAQVVPITMDISKPEDVAAVSDAATKQFGKVDIWINMAGIGAIGKFWEIPLNDYSRLIDINLKGVIYGSQEAIKLFVKQGYGTLINAGSVESEVPLAYHAVYASSKGAILNLDQALNQELRLNGMKEIKVVTIEPWAIDTPFWENAANYSGGTARMASMDRAEKPVNATVRSCVRRKKEVAVGWKAKSSRKSHHLFPHFTEKVAANIVHKYQIETSPPLPPTPGTLYKLSPIGSVDGGVEERMEKENKERKKNKKVASK